MNVTPFEKQVQLIQFIVEGCSLRGAARLGDVHQDTLGRLALAVGEGCARLHDATMRDLAIDLVQLDEQHSYVHTRQVTIKNGKTKTAPLDEHGEQWTFAALAVKSRAVVAWLVGKRSADNANQFVSELRRRLATKSNLAGDVAVTVVPTIAADGFKAYVDAVRLAFGTEVNFGQLVKIYEDDYRNAAKKGEKQGGEKPAERQPENKPETPGPKGRTYYKHYKDAQKVIVSGRPDERDIHTSYIERLNLTTRTDLRRFMRKTAGFSKKLRHHKAAVALQYSHYNFCRYHETLRTTPAMALGVTDHVWTVSELIERALNQPPPPPLPPIAPHGDQQLPKNSRWHGVDPARRPVGRPYSVYSRST